MQLAFFIVALILFVLAALPLPTPTTRWPSYATPLVAIGLAFLAAAFAVPQLVR